MNRLVLLLYVVLWPGLAEAASPANAAGSPNAAAAKPGRPNIVIILADDLGYGDVRAMNPDSKLPTPHLDRLAARGMTFTDAHTPSAVCTPTRYALLTGRYCWRSKLKKGVLGGYSPPLLEPGRQTIAGMLQEQGYQTAAVGKWHLGMALPMKDGKQIEEAPWHGDPGVDFGGEITDGPLQHGFDSCFLVSASLDMAPYVYVKNNRYTMQPTLQQPAVRFPHFVRQGPRAEDFVIDGVLDRLADEAIAFITKAAEKEKPFFLYLPLTAPHKPAQPHERFRGTTGLGEYGDFVAQVDATAGRVLKSLEEAGAADSTVVMFSSDNGSYMYSFTDDRRDHADDSLVQGFRADRHRSNGPFRGTKADIWEAGHHVPLLVRWPGRVAEKSRCETTVCLTDLYATCAAITGAEIDGDAAEDSASLLPLLQGNSTERGAPVVHHSVAGMFAIRAGKWKLILGNGSGGREAPRGQPFGTPYQLFDMTADPGETTDLASQHPEVVQQLTDRLEEIRRSGRSIDR